MRRFGMTMVLALAVVTLACSDDGGGSSSPSTTRDPQTPLPTADVSAAADTPFCQTYAEIIQIIEDYRADPDPDDEATLEELQPLHQTLTDQAPPQIQNDVESNNQNVQNASTVGELLFVSPINQRLSEDIRTFVESDCNIQFDQ
jgi:hypothetical protein